MRRIVAAVLLCLALSGTVASEGQESFTFDCQTNGNKGKCAQIESLVATPDLVKLLDFGTITNFMAEDTAKEILASVKGMDGSEWTRILSGPEGDQDNTFDRNKRRKAGVRTDYQMIDLQLEFFSELREKIAPHFEKLFLADKRNEMVLYLAKYQTGAYMSSHRDVKGDNTLNIKGEDYLRHRGFALYLNRQWDEADGGIFTDEDDGDKSYVPTFNKLLHYKVPRWHSITPVKGKKTLAVVYGWVLIPKPTTMEQVQAVYKEIVKNPKSIMPGVFLLIVAIRLYFFPISWSSKPKKEAEGAVETKTDKKQK